MIGTCRNPNFQTCDPLRRSGLDFAKSQTAHLALRVSSSSLKFACYRKCVRLPGPKLRSSLRPAVQDKGRFDPELRSVLELATDGELSELANILFGRSYFSPLLKSLIGRNNGDDLLHEEPFEIRDDFIQLIESRFLFLAADARQTLRGWRPSYRDVLLDLRRKLKVPCSTKLKTGDLEAEIFLHLLQGYSSNEEASFSFPWKNNKFSNHFAYTDEHLSISKIKGNSLVVSKVGLEEIQSILLKGGGMLTLAKIYQLLRRTLSGKFILEAANYQIKHEAIQKGGQLAAANLEHKVALLAARKGLASAASRYFGLRSVMTLLGPVLWGTFLADVVIQMIGTDYARIVRAVYGFAQIRLTRTYGWTPGKD